MVATKATRYFPGDLSSRLVSASPRQSSLRSVTSTHSRRSLEKSNSVVSTSQRRVHFSCTNELDLSDRDDTDDIGTIQVSVHEFEFVEPVDALYLTPREITLIRCNVRAQAAQFAADHPDFVEQINELLENGISVADASTQIESLRRRRRRRYCNGFQASTKGPELDPESSDGKVFGDEEKKVKEVIPELYGDDDAVDSDYFGPVRGLETRISPLFRIRRRWAIHGVLDLQQEMKGAGCCTTQVEMGLRAVCVQVAQKARSFALLQAALDEWEATTSQ